MSDEMRIIGGIPDDPRVQAALDKIEQSGDVGITEAITSRPAPTGLAKYGVVLRPPGLMQSAMLGRIMKIKGDIAPEFQAFIYLFTLGAKIEDVYNGLEALEQKGFPAFMVCVHNWFDNSGIPAKVDDEVIQAVTETFSVAMKLLPKDEPEQQGDETVIKKNALPGTA